MFDAPRIGKNPYETILVEVWKLIMLHNRVSLSGLSRDDLQDVAAGLQQQYPISVVEAARDEIKAFADQGLTLGIFLQKCAALNRVEKSISSTQELFKSTNRQQRLAKEKITEMKEMLKNCIKPLPYNKDYREPAPSKYGSYPGDGTDKMGYRELEDHLAKKRLELHADLVSFGQIRAFEDVPNEELRALYKKAWTHGVTREEKDRMQELSGNTVIM